MIRNLKALGLSLVAMFALGAVGASTASAVDVLTTEGGQPALLTGVGHTDKFEITGGPKYECTTSKFAATAKNLDSVTTVDVSYDGTLNVGPPHTTHCNASAGNVTVNMTGCDYDLTGNTTGDHNGEADKDATVWITCPEGKAIDIKSSLGPTITVPQQTPTEGGVTYTDVLDGKIHAVTVKTTVTGVTYTCHPTFSCTLGGTPHHGNNSDYSGHVLMRAYEDNNQSPQITPADEGKQISLTSSTA